MAIKAILLLFVFVPTLWLWTEIIQSSVNSFFRHPEWVVYKRTLQMLTVGSDEFLLSRTGLAKNQFNTAPWWGHHGLIYKPKIEPQEVSLNVSLQDKGYAYILFGDSERGWQGLRFSTDPVRPNAYIEFATDDEIQIQEPLDKSSDASSAAIHLQFQDHSLIASINGQEVFRRPLKEASGFLRFHGGEINASFSRITGVDSLGQSFSLGFRNMEVYANVLGLVATVLLFAGAFVFLISRKTFVFSYFLVLLTGLLLGGSYYLFDHLFWAQVQQSALTRPLRLKAERPVGTFEKARSQFFHWVYELAGGRKVTPDAIAAMGYPNVRYFAGPFFCPAGSLVCQPESDIAEALKSGDLPVKSKTQKPSKKLRLLYLGTSQTAGAGADLLQNTFFVRTHQILQKQFDGRVESLNLAESASKLGEQEAVFDQVYELYKPDLVILNFSVNDDELSLRAGWPGFLQKLKAKGIRVVVVKEATRVDRGALEESPMNRKYQLTEMAATQAGVFFFPLHDYMNSPEVISKGMLWIDFVHLSSLGQKYAAQWLAVQLTPILSEL